jgi:hypothetical protein
MSHLETLKVLTLELENCLLIPWDGFSYLMVVLISLLAKSPLLYGLMLYWD